MGKIQVESIDQFHEIVQANNKFLLFKHSLTCPISKDAYSQFEKFVMNNKDAPAFYLYVQQARPLSNYIAETYQIKHESPQALLFEDGKVTWNASHWRITEEVLNNKVSVK